MTDSKVGVIIGRFQPFHLGHAWLIKKALQKFNKIIILIGSSNVDDKSNPWNLKERISMLNKFIEYEGISKNIIKVDEIEDVPDDGEWLELALKKIGVKNFEIVGDNDWVNGIFEDAGYVVWKTGYYSRDTLEGTKIRNLLKENEYWEDRVPKYLVELIRL